MVPDANMTETIIFTTFLALRSHADIIFVKGYHDDMFSDDS